MALYWLVLGSWAKPQRLPIEKFTAHPYACRACHEPQYTFWEKTKHASAYVTLFNKGQHFDPECISCHSLGFRHPGGFKKMRDSVQGKISSIEFSELLEPRTDSLEKLNQRYHAKVHSLEKEGKIEKFFIGVQCEHCHGVRGTHPGGAKSKKVSTTNCRTCHIPDRSPHFQDAWLSKVACPMRSNK